MRLTTLSDSATAAVSNAIATPSFPRVNIDPCLLSKSLRMAIALPEVYPYTHENE